MFKLPFVIISSAKLKAQAAAREKLAGQLSLLKVQRELAEAALRSMVEGVFAVDQNGKIIFANIALEKMFGVTEPEILNQTVREGLRNNEITDIVTEVLLKCKPETKEIEIVVPVEKCFIIHAAPIVDQAQKLAGAVCVLHDISDLKKLENYRSEFVANVSHELKTPLTAIRNYVETLLDGAINDQKHNADFLQKINKHAINLSALIDDILEVSRLETKKELGQFVSVDLHQLIGRAVETVASKAQKKNIEVKTACHGVDFTVTGLYEHLYRAIVNLLDNAVNYTSDGGKIEITCRKTGQGLELAVTDTGIGISADHLSRIFERFYRVDQARSRDLGGTGLGLAIVKHVMNLHNGTVAVESEEGKGSKFILFLPA